jgi:ABC-type Zn2+ transport system substrate-binding protein/surface adhesin
MHPEHPALPHLEDDAPSALDGAQAEANASIGATDPGSIPDALEGHDHHHHDHDHDHDHDHGDAVGAGEIKAPAKAGSKRGKR